MERGLYVLLSPIQADPRQAIWFTGSNWPADGEIDVVEGVGLTTMNVMSTHTSAGCNQQSGGFSGSFMMNDNSKRANCDALATGDQGCGVRSLSKTSFGVPFNSQGGGVFALKWDGSVRLLSILAAAEVSRVSRRTTLHATASPPTSPLATRIPAPGARPRTLSRRPVAPLPTSRTCCSSSTPISAACGLMGRGPRTCHTPVRRDPARRRPDFEPAQNTCARRAQRSAKRTFSPLDL